MEWRDASIIFASCSFCFTRGFAFTQRHSTGFVRNAPFEASWPRIVALRRHTSRFSAGNDNDLLHLHRTVAREDAEWYQRFVADVLGDETMPVVEQIESPQNTAAEEAGKAMKPREAARRNFGKESLTGEAKISLKEAIGLKVDSRKRTGFAVEHRKSTSTKPAAPSEVIPLMQINESSAIIRNETKVDGLNNTAASGQDTLLTNHSGSNASAADDKSEENVADTVDIIQQQHNMSETILREKQTINSTGIDSNESSDDRTVLYRDLYTASLKAVSLSEMNALGYSADEIPYLQPDALALIVSDKIKKPTRGIPRQWMISDSQYQILSKDVRVVSTCEATDILDAARQKKRRNVVERQQKAYEAIGQSEPEVEYNSSDSRPNTTVPDELDGKPRRASRREERRRSRTTGLAEDRETMEQRRVRAARDETKIIYNVRGSPRRRRPVNDDDPPPPKGPLWVDVDTFRNLLRSEAKLRVRILGEDWADVVKEESNWRLRLYKEWLWTLDRGWGSPLIPSRSERGKISDRGRRSQSRLSEDVASGAERTGESRRRPRSYEASSRRRPRDGPR